MLCKLIQIQKFFEKIKKRNIKFNYSFVSKKMKNKHQEKQDTDVNQ